MRYGLGEETISKISSVFAAHAKIKQVKIYGSRAKGDYKNGSDIDLRLFADNLSSDELSRAKNYSIDLCDFRAIQRQIRRSGYFYLSHSRHAKAVGAY